MRTPLRACAGRFTVTTVDTVMQTRAIAATRATAASLRLPIDEVVVLNTSNKLTAHLLPCDVLARIAPTEESPAAFELDIARRIAEAGSPVAAPTPRVEPRVHGSDDFDITLWTYYPPARGQELAALEYADALATLHAGMRTVGAETPHFTDRVNAALLLLADRERTPDLTDTDRALLDGTLRRLAPDVRRRGREQLLHGEPHPGNVLPTTSGAVFIDFETCCRGPVEFDLAHAPDEVAQHYPGADLDLVDTCRMLTLAMVTTWRWDRDDQLPDGRLLAHKWLHELRTALTSHAGAYRDRRCYQHLHRH